MSARCNRCLDAMGAGFHMWGAVSWCRQCALDHGGLVGRRAVALADIGSTAEAFTPDALKRLAAGPVMDANALFLPAGKISMADAKARENAGLEIVRAA